MDVLLFRMETKQLKKKTKKNSVLYTGTHDNATCNEDYHTYDSNKRISLRRFFKNQGYSSRSFNEMLCQYALDTDCRFGIFVDLKKRHESIHQELCRIKTGLGN